MEELKIRPYARLLSMLGDQLIKNETIALTELVKNSYDADATECKVCFKGFDSEKLSNYDDASIVVEDDGNGMSYEVITTHFLNPATPIKRAKENEEPRKSLKGRIVQGEKGIGRFSMLKLGRIATILSKEENIDTVHKVVFDFAKYDDEFLSSIENINGQEVLGEKEIFLDEIVVKYESFHVADFPERFFAKKGKGTTITIEKLKGQWDTSKINDFEKGLLRFNPFELDNDVVVENQDFSIDTYINDKEHDYQSDVLNKLRDIVFHKALYEIHGKYDESGKKLLFSYSEAGSKPQSVEIYLTPGIAEQLKLNSVAIRATQDFQALPIYREDGRKDTTNRRQRLFDFYKDNSATECGDFEFNFYIFDFKANPKDPLGLSKSEKDIIREHRVFLYRDGVRVQPYGAPDDDWLQIDRHRAEIRANEQFSNDQLFGQIKITKAGNEKLKDKTSREGIIEDSQAFTQLIFLVRGLLSYVRTKLLQNYDYKTAKQKENIQIAENFIEVEFAQLKTELTNNTKALQKLGELQRVVQKRENIYSQRIDIAEQLAGVGLSVEVASHDIMLTIDRLKDNIHQINIDTAPGLFRTDGTWDAVHQKTDEAEGMIGLVYMKMKDIQQLFVSSKQRPKLIEVEIIIEKIQSIYAKAFADNGIKVEYEKIGSPVKAKVIDAVLYQVFINLFDNALYWIQETSKNRLVKITLDGFNQRAIFSDNGIGVKYEDVPYIFDAFYTGKGEEGRGLGLYIARKLLEKSGYGIDIITNDSEKVLSGANFVVTFVTKEGE
jgi:signal transduction histidine kinase